MLPAQAEIWLVSKSKSAPIISIAFHKSISFVIWDADDGWKSWRGHRDAFGKSWSPGLWTHKDRFSPWNAIRITWTMTMSWNQVLYNWSFFTTPQDICWKTTTAMFCYCDCFIGRFFSNSSKNGGDMASQWNWLMGLAINSVVILYMLWASKGNTEKLPVGIVYAFNWLCGKTSAVRIVLEFALSSHTNKVSGW